MVAVIAITVIPFNFSSASTDHSANFITDVKLDTTETTIGQRFQVEYFWAIPDNVDVGEGDTMRVKLPEEISLWDDVSFELRDENNNLVGHGVAKAGTKEVVVTFTDYPVGKVNVHGSMKVWVGIDRDNSNVNGGETTTLTFPTTNGEVKIDIGIGDIGDGFEIPEGEKLNKWGYWYTWDPDKIPWNVRINAHKDTIPNAVYKDTLGEGHTFIPESLKIYIGDVDGNGYPIKENGIPTAQVANMLTYTAQSFELQLGDISDIVSIEYQTRLINPQPGTIYRNEGNLTGTDVDENIESGAEYRGAAGNGTGDDGTANVELTKTDNDRPSVNLPGATFKLLDENGSLLQENLVTDSQGKLTIPELAIGSYQLVETAPPAGYKLDSTPISFEITAFDTGSTIRLQMGNTAEGTVVLTKKDADHADRLLSGAVFSLYKADGTLVSADFQTNSSGTITANLPIGDYYFVETKAPAGYELDATPRHFSITYDNFTDTQNVTVTNKEIEEPPVVEPEEPKGSMELIKRDATDNSKRLAGAEFRLTGDNGESRTITTDATGSAKVGDLPVGKYTLVETKAPAGYELDATPHTFEITEANHATVQIVTVDNIPEPIIAPEESRGSLELIKRDATDNTNRLAGAEFQLKGDNIASQTITTDSSGSVTVTDLPVGKYTLVETKAPAGYELDPTPHTFEITEENHTTVQVVTVENTPVTPEPPKGSVQLQKVDAANNNGLAGATFQLLDASGTVIQTVTTNASGILTMTDLELGKYSLVETKAPTGYVLDGTPVNFEITESNATQMISLTKENEKIEVPEIHKNVENYQLFDWNVLAQMNNTKAGVQNLTLSNRDDAFVWNIDTIFGNDTASWTKAVITDEINSLLTIEDVQIKDAQGKDVTGNGTLAVDGNNITFTLNKQEDSFAFLAGQTYTMSVRTVIKDGVTDEQLAPFIKDGGIPNQAELAFGNEGDLLVSEIPTVTPPTVNPEIHKDIEKQEHLDLTNRDDAFDWNIHTAFGNQTASWNQAIITDQINNLLAIKNIQIVDENGNDVTANGTITEENNLITFTMHKKDDSFAYLAGHTYTMTVTTEIKADTTDEQLAPFIQEGGIPNQAELAFGNEGDLLKSEIPTVTPPTVNPEIHKDIEGVQHVDLANRNDAFNWNIQTIFGNQTATWNQAIITDQIHEFLNIEKIQITDENGTDVTENGTITQENNLITFTMDKKEDSFAYLAGHTYTMTVTTTIKANVTDEQLAAFQTKQN